MKKISFKKINEWAQLGHTMNWYDYTIINLSLENDIVYGLFHITFIFFGLGFTINIELGETEKRKELMKMIEDNKITN